MAALASQKLEEKLACSICLELFRAPVTLPCGHNFCKGCISGHWHKEQARPGPQRGYSCPQCRRSFPQRPELDKNVTLSSVVELVRDGEAHALGTERCEVARGELCLQHGHLLELYCEDEQRCVCCICTIRQCQPHRLVPFEEECAKKQALLKESLEKSQEESERMKKEMQELEEKTHHIKESSEELKSVILSKFTLLRKALENFQCRTVARIEQEQAAALERIGENWSLLKDHLDVLDQHRVRAQRLLTCPDHRTFLQEFPRLPTPESAEALLPVEFDVADVVKPIAEVLTDISRLLQEDLPGSVAPGGPDPIGQGPVPPQEPTLKVVAPLLDCHLRDELLKGEECRGPGWSHLLIINNTFFPANDLEKVPRRALQLGLLQEEDHRNLTFDPDTANRYLELSKGNRKATHVRSPPCAQPGQGPRFEPWQVLCTQGYGRGHHYWEVKVSSHSVILGLTYRGLPWAQPRGHKFSIGLDQGSWGLQVREDCYLAWHKGHAEKIQEQLYKNLGVRLDYGKGLLSFYGLGESMRLIHSFHDVFIEPLYPVFWLCEGRAVTLCHRG